MDIQNFIEEFKKNFVYDMLSQTLTDEQLFDYFVMDNGDIVFSKEQVRQMWSMWQAAKADLMPDQIDINSMLHDIDCYFDSGLSNTERTANNLIQSIYEKLTGEVKAQEPSNE